MKRHTVIKRLRRVAATFDADHRYVLQKQDGETVQWSGANMAAYFAALADLMEANSRHDRRAQAAALVKLSQMDGNELPADIKAVCDQLLRQRP